MSEASEPSKRRGRRWEVAGVHGAFVEAVPVEVVGLSLGGMAVETSQPLRTGGEYWLELETGERRLWLTGTAVWSRPLPAPGEQMGRHRSGINFEAISGGTVGDLSQFIRDHAGVDLTPSLLDRLGPEPGRPARLESHRRFEVKTLGAWGMLVESELRPRIEERLDLELRLDGFRWRSQGRIASLPGNGHAGRPVLHRLGVEFDGLTPERRSALEEFLDNHLG